MSGPTPAHPTFYRPADVAKMLRCSEWWVKEQARRRRIPFSWIGGSYLFTEEHVAEIVRRFERQPIEGTDIPTGRAPRRPAASDNTSSSIQLHARTPRRARNAATAKPAA